MFKAKSIHPTLDGATVTKVSNGKLGAVLAALGAIIAFLLPVLSGDFEAAWEVIGWYEKRPVVEDYHKDVITF